MSKEVKKLLRSEMLEGQQVPISILKFGEEDTREDHPGEFQWIQSLFCLGNKSSRICFLNGTVRLRNERLRSAHFKLIEVGGNQVKRVSRLLSVTVIIPIFFAFFSPIAHANPTPLPDPSPLPDPKPIPDSKPIPDQKPVPGSKNDSDSGLNADAPNTNQGSSNNNLASLILRGIKLSSPAGFAANLLWDAFGDEIV